LLDVGLHKLFDHGTTRINYDSFIVFKRVVLLLRKKYRREIMIINDVDLVHAFLVRIVYFLRVVLTAFAVKTLFLYINVF